MLFPSIVLATQFGVEGDLSVWGVFYEENENGRRQRDTNDEAADTASGFNLNRARIVFDFQDYRYDVFAKFQLRLEEMVDVLDAYGMWRPEDWFSLRVGQMKIPSTYEVLTPAKNLDFISRSTFSQKIGDWSLSRAPYYGSFYANKLYNRDTGIAVKGNVALSDERDLLDYFFMVGNGLGHSLYIGGKESKEFITSNDLGDFFYGLRLDLYPWQDKLLGRQVTLGGHYLHNKHDDILFNDEKTVFDLYRTSWSIDCQADFKMLRFAAMYGEGFIDDDFFHTGTKNLEYSGWETKLLVRFWDERIEVGGRYDVYSSEMDESGNVVDQKNITVGVSYIPQTYKKSLKFQLNYITKETDNDLEPDLRDNIIFLNMQYNLFLNYIL